MSEVSKANWSLIAGIAVGCFAAVFMCGIVYRHQRKRKQKIMDAPVPAPRNSNSKSPIRIGTGWHRSDTIPVLPFRNRLPHVPITIVTTPRAAAAVPAKMHSESPESLAESGEGKSLVGNGLFRERAKRLNK